MENQIKAGAALNYVIIGINALVGLLYTPYMLRMLGQNEYGLFSLVASVISYLTILDFGFGNAIVRYTAKFRTENKTTEQYEMFGMFLKLFCAIGLFALCIGIILCFNVDNLFDKSMSPEELSKAKILLLILLINLALTFPLSVYGSIINAYENFIFQKLAQIARIVLSTIVMIVILRLGYKAIGLVVVQTIFNIAFLFGNAFYCRHKLKIKIVFGKMNWNFFREILFYSFWIFLAAITEQFYWNSGQWALGIFQGTTMVAIFSLAIQLKGMFYLFSSAISSVFLPKVTRMVTSNTTAKEISDLFIRTGRIQYAVISYIIVGFVIFGKSFITLWVGEEYMSVYYITLMIFVCTTIPSIQNLGNSILMAYNKMKRKTIIVIFASLLSFVAIFPCAKYWGAVGCSFPIFLCIVITYGPILNKMYARVIGINVRQFWIEILKMSLVPSLFVVAGLLILPYTDFSDWGKLGLGIIAFSVFYLPVSYRLSLNNYERNYFNSFMRKIKFVR
ncbi:flippase [Bacteroides caccae]|nr:flippase [Bacteroides caccae]